MVNNQKIQWFREGNKSDGIIFFKKHPSRKHGVKYDRYFKAEYQHQKKRISFNFGWESDGWSISKCQEKLKWYKANAKAGNGPTCPKDEREIEHEKKEAESIKAETQKKLDLTFDDFFHGRYIPAAKTHKKPFTVENEKGLYKNWILPELGHLSFNKIKAFNLEKIRKNMTDAKRSPRSTQYVLALVRQCWNMAIAHEVITEPFPKIKTKKFDNKRLRFFSHDEAAALLEELMKRSEQVHDMALLSLHTGARAGEIFALTWGAVDLVGGVLTAKDSKSGKNRFLYLTRATRAVLEKRFQGQGSDAFVFPDRNGDKVKSVSDTFERVVERLGLNVGVTDPRDKATFHTLRHTFASWHVQNGTDLYTVKELLGHSTIALTERYSHLRPDALKQTAELFDKMVRPVKVVRKVGR